MKTKFERSGMFIPSFIPVFFFYLRKILILDIKKQARNELNYNHWNMISALSPE